MRGLIVAFVMMIGLAGCSEKQVVPLAQPSDPTVLLAKPPSQAMEPVHKSQLLVPGQPNSVQTGIMRQNNLWCADDRLKAAALQMYVLGIFNPKSQ